MRIKLTVGEIKTLNAALGKAKSKCGFRCLLTQLSYILDESTGEIDLYPEHLNRIHTYAFEHNNANRRKILLAVFQRTLGPDLLKGLVFEE